MKNTDVLNELKKDFKAYKEMFLPEGLTPEKQKEMYKNMVLTREFETAVKPLWMANKVSGYFHPYIIAEAIAAGVCANLRKDDMIGSTHRGHGHVICKGGDINKMMAELYGKVEGYCKGRGGSMHIACMDIGMLGATGIVGAGMPSAVGSALASSVKGNDNVTVVFHGDGASNSGVWAESVNMAAAWNLPVIFVCENNQWAIATEISRVVRETDLYKRGIGYGVPSFQCDGFNIYDIYETTRQAVARARAGEGPTVIEAKYLRVLGHHATDDNWYRDMTKVEPYWELDPIKRMREFMLANKIATKKELEAIEADCKKAVDESIEYAEKCTEPSPDSLYDDLYANGEIIK
ncbi:MAG: thiamine pyrophosphate-dependent dehydrogenase E1 component subunit alpha [Bacillota bacterium]